MNKKIILLVLVMFLAVGYSWADKNDVSRTEGLIKRSQAVENDIDKLLEQAHEISSKVSQNSIPGEMSVSTRVITPKDIANNLIAPKNRNKKMNLEFQKANLEDVLMAIGKAGEFNIVLDPALKGKKVDIHLSNTPIEEALNLLYNAYDLGSYQIGNSLFVASKAKIKSGTVVTRVIKLRNVSVDEAEGLIDKLVDTINKSSEINTLVITGTPQGVNKAEEILYNLDKPQPQVILEAKIIEINRDALRELGIDWSDSITAAFQESKRPLALSDTASNMGSVFRVYKLSRSAIAFNTVLKMLETEDKAKVLSNPRVATINNKEAEIFVGDEVPYTITTVTGGVASTEVRFVTPGISLKITPSIIDKEFVVIKIEPEVSYIYGWRGPNDEYPWVKTRKATAYVRVNNKQPFILGGLLTKEDKNTLYKIPMLGSVPLFGNLFKYNHHTVANSELIITVIPTVVSQ